MKRIGWLALAWLVLSLAPGAAQPAGLCHGQGGPTVVFDYGLGSSYDSSYTLGAIWDEAVAEVAKFARVCTVAPDLSTVLAMPTPPDSLALARMLREELRKAGERGPFVLVGDHLGAHTVRVFAKEYPADTAGLVLYYAALPDEHTRLIAALKPERRAASWARFPEWLITHGGARMDTAGSLKRAAEAGPLGAKPLVVVSPDRAMHYALPPALSAEEDRVVQAAYRKAQEDLARLSTNSRLVWVKPHPHPGKDTPQDAAVVADAVRRVQGAARTGAKLK